MATDPLERVKRIIRELQKKTVDNGCTEAEAMEAARLMGELLSKHDLELDEVGMKAETAQCKKNLVHSADDFSGALIVGISSLCDLVAYRSGHGEYTLFGTPHDLEIGKYLYEVCCEAMDHDWGGYMEQYGYSMKKRASFRMGFAGRVCARLKELKEERRRAMTGTALVVLKDQLVKSEWDKLGIKLTPGPQRVIADRNAYYSGRAAGEKVNLNNPIAAGAGSAGRIK